MIEFARRRNDCFASCQTIANAVGCKPNTVKKARRRLRTLGFCTSQQCRGGKGFIAHYRPNSRPSIAAILFLQGGDVVVVKAPRPQAS